MVELAHSFTFAGPLTTDRMVLRRYEPGDLTAIHDLFGRADVSRYLRWEPLDLEGARAKLAQRIGQTRIAADGDAVVVAAVEAASGRTIGEFMLRLISVANAQGELGWSLHPDVQGRGLATEGAREMLRLGFDEVGLHRIVATCDPRNRSSIRVMERLGMRREGEFVESERMKGEWVGEIVSAMLVSEWRTLAG